MEEMRRKWYLQLFADDPDDPDPEPNDPDEDEGPDEGEDPDEGKDPKKISMTQAELDELIKKAKAADRKTFRSQLEKQLKEEAEEEKKKAKMSAEDKVKYELEQYQKRVAQLEKAQEEARLGVLATKQLKESGIDAGEEILEFLIGEDEETTDKRVKAFVDVVTAAVEAKEKERATGKTPKSTNTKRNEVSEMQKRINKYK